MGVRIGWYSDERVMGLGWGFLDGAEALEGWVQGRLWMGRRRRSGRRGLAFVSGSLVIEAGE